MANQLITDLSAATIINPTDLLFKGNPSTGELEKAEVSLLNSLLLPDWLKAMQELGSNIKSLPIGSTPHNYSATTTITAQRVSWELMKVYKAETITGIGFIQTVQGAYTANNYNGVGLYSLSSGTLSLLASSTTDGNLFKNAAGTYVEKDFSTPYAAQPGIYAAAIVWSGTSVTTTPQLQCMPTKTNNAIVELDFPDSVKLSTLLSGQTSLPNPVAMSALTGQLISIFRTLY